MRNIKRFFLISFIMGIMLSAFALAATGPLALLSSAWDSILGLGQLNFLGQADSQLIGFLRILVFVLTFTVWYSLAALGRGFLGGVLTRNISITLSLVLALLSTILIPASVLMAIAGSGSLLMGTLFLVLFNAPLLLALFAIPNNGRGVYAFKALVAAFGWWVASQIAVLTDSLSATGNAIAGAATVTPGGFGFATGGMLEFFGYISFFYIVMALWNVGKLISGGRENEEEVDQAAKDATGKAIKGLKKGWKKLNAAKPEKWTLLVFLDLKKLETHINNASDNAKLDELKKDVNKDKRHESKAYQRINQLESNLNKLPAGAKKNALKKIFKDEIQLQNNNIIAEMKNFETELNKAGTFSNRKTKLLASVKKMLTAETALQAGFTNFKAKAAEK